MYLLEDLVYTAHSMGGWQEMAVTTKVVIQGSYGGVGRGTCKQNRDTPTSTEAFQGGTFELKD